MKRHVLTPSFRWFWAFSDLLTGSMGLYAEDATDKAKRWFNVLGSNIGATALLGTSDLDCFFAGGCEFSPTASATLDV